jgi:hypothetical protein
MHSVVWQIVPESCRNLEEFLIGPYFNIVIINLHMVIALAMGIYKTFLCADFLVHTYF